MANPLSQIDAILKENVLDLWEPIHDLIEHAGELHIFDFWKLVPEHEKASCEETDFTDELVEKHGIPFRVLQERLFPAQRKQEEAITRLYLAIGFVLGARLSGATEEKVKCLMNTYSFGLSEPPSSE